MTAAGPSRGALDALPIDSALAGLLSATRALSDGLRAGGPPQTIAALHARFEAAHAAWRDAITPR